jgi:hypothetical protein
MRYIDTGGRDPEQSVGAWLQSVLTNAITEARWQSGFFTSDALGLFAPTLQRLATLEGLLNALVGSNDPGSMRADVLELVRIAGVPRANAQLGVVQYGNGFYHPKTFHFRRRDGGQCAYVGSANLTGAGITSQHVEAGLVLDTADGDPADVLNKIADAIDEWFRTRREGMHLVNSAADVDQLVTDGVLQLVPPPRPPAPPGGGGGGRTTSAPPRLRPLFTLPGLPRAAPPPPEPPALPAPPASVVIAPAPVSVNRTGFPPEVFFDPVATGPTSGANGLSGHPLPHGAAGLIVRLTRDDTRVFGTAVGTANINLPVASIPSLRFGILARGGYPNRPRAEFDLYARYVAANGQVLRMPDVAETNVMLYGYLAGESGHHNRRMLLPADLRQLRDLIAAGGFPMPTAGHLALMEWPVLAAPEFRITFLDPGSALGQQAQQTFTAANGTQLMLADNSCVLLSGVSPPW